jgi:hypothetical protein
MPATVKGALDLRKALRNYAPELAKETRKEMAAILKPITQVAKGFLPAQAPLTNWGREGGKFPVYNASIAKRGIGYKTTPSKPNSQGFRALAQIRNMSAAGAIYETAGRKNPGGSSKSKSRNPNAGRQFIEALEPLEGSGNDRGRVIYKAWEKDYGKATVAILKAIKNAGNKFNSTVGNR